MARSPGKHRDEKGAQDRQGEVGLDTEPGDGDGAPDDGRHLRPFDAERHAAHDREGDSRLVPHEAGQRQQEKGGE